MQREVDNRSRRGNNIRAVRFVHLHTQVETLVIQVEIQLVGFVNTELNRRSFRD